MVAADAAVPSVATASESEPAASSDATETIALDPADAAEESLSVEQLSRSILEAIGGIDAA